MFRSRFGRVGSRRMREELVAVASERQVVVEIRMVELVGSIWDQTLSDSNNAARETRRVKNEGVRLRVVFTMGSDVGLTAAVRSGDIEDRVDIAATPMRCRSASSPIPSIRSTPDEVDRILTLTNVMVSGLRRCPVSSATRSRNSP